MNAEPTEHTLVRICLARSGISRNLNNIIDALNKKIFEANKAQLETRLPENYDADSATRLRFEQVIYENKVLLSSNSIASDLQPLFTGQELTWLRNLATQEQIVVRTALQTDGTHEVALVLNLPTHTSPPSANQIPMMTGLSVTSGTNDYSINKVRLLNPAINEQQLTEALLLLQADKNKA